MRKESSNQFTEGLVCDLNPINTPNTVLTDALNATIITYDGNEFSLQNDRGNYPLENCRLKPNYIPVGIKEYGDILYIVSYNPLDNHVEVGSYPSPLEVKASNLEPMDFEVQSILENIVSEDYKNLISNRTLHIYTGDNEEEWKIYPGDEYRIDEVKSDYKYEELEYYIIDENREKSNITDKIVKNKPSYPSWQTPGWLAAQYRVAMFDDFNLNIKSITSPSLQSTNISTNLFLNFQLKISDRLLLTSESLQTDVYIDVKIFKKSGSTLLTKQLSLSEGSLIDWYDNAKILWINDKYSLSGLNKGDEIVIHATPYLYFNSKKITYEDLKDKYTFRINSIGDAVDFKLGETRWQFYPDGKGVMLEYSVTGPNVTKDVVNLYYKVTSLSGEEVSEWKEVPNYNGIGDQNMSSIPYSGKFASEGIYIFDFAFAESKDKIDSSYKITKLVITSSIFLKFTSETNYDKITFNQWSRHFWDFIKFNPDLSLTTSGSWTVSRNYDWDPTTKEFSYDFENDDLDTLWKQTDSDNKGLITSKEALTDIKIKFKGSSNGTISGSIAEKVLKGPLWNNSVNFTLNFNGKKIDTKSADGLSKISKTCDILIGKEKTYSHKNRGPVKSIINLNHIEKIPALWLREYLQKDSSNETMCLVLHECGYFTTDGVLKDPTSHQLNTIKCDEEVKIPNATTKKIISAMGNNPIAILGLTVNPYADGGYTGELLFEWSNGTETWYDGKNNTDYIYMFLVMKQKSSDTPVFIPMDIPEVWKKSFEVTGLHYSGWTDSKLSEIKSKVSSELEKLKNVIICTENNSIKSSYLTEIDYSNASNKITSSNTLDIKSDKIKNWYYNGNKKEDLFDNSFRKGIVKSFGLDTELLNGTNPELSDLSYTINLNPNVTDNDYANIDKDIESFDKTIASINSLINEPTINNSLLTKMSGRNTKGVYYLSTTNSALISDLDKSYSGNSDKDLYASNSWSLTTGKFELTGDNDTLEFCKMTSQTFDL